MFCSSAVSERLEGPADPVGASSRECHHRSHDERLHPRKLRLFDSEVQKARCPLSDKKFQRSRVGRANIGNIVLIASALLALLSHQKTFAGDGGVNCFKCSSRNGSNPACEDPFHNINVTQVTAPVLPDPQPNVIYHTPCYAGRKNREGLFPASACIKLTGRFDTTGETLVVRHCALDSGSLTQDTELARMSHCGKFQFEGDLLKGCVLACPEDACNSAHRSTVSRQASFIALLLAPLISAIIL